MKRIEIADTADNASNYQLEDGRIYRIHMKLITPKEQLATSDYVEVETRGFEVTKNGSFVVDDDGVPVSLPLQRARLPLANVRAGNDTAKPGWVKQDLPGDEEARAEHLSGHSKLKAIPKTGSPGDVKRVGDELYSYTEGLYDQVRRARLNEVLPLVDYNILNDAQIAALIP